MYFLLWVKITSVILYWSFIRKDTRRFANDKGMIDPSLDTRIARANALRNPFRGMIKLLINPETKRPLDKETICSKKENKKYLLSNFFVESISEFLRIFIISSKRRFEGFFSFLFQIRVKFGNVGIQAWD